MLAFPLTPPSSRGPRREPPRVQSHRREAAADRERRHAEPPQSALRYKQEHRDQQVPRVSLRPGGQAGRLADIGGSAARKHVDGVWRDWGGLKAYVPMGRGLNNQERDAEIARRWTGDNARELCRAFDLSEPHLRRIIKAEG